MTQILRPTIETTNDGFYYDPATHLSSIAISPTGVAFPYGNPTTVQQIGVVWPDASGVRPGSGAATTYGLADPRFFNYKAISAPATLEGQSVKTVTYSGFPVFVDAWATGALTLQIGVNSTGTIMSNDTAPVVKVEYSWNNGATWSLIYEQLWNVDAGDAGSGHRWLQPQEHLGTGVILKLNAFTNNQSVSSGYTVSLPMSGHDTTKLQVKFTVAGGYIIPQGWPTNTSNAPSYIGVGFQVADIWMTDPSAVAAPPGATGASASSNTLVIKSGPGPVGNLDAKNRFAQVVNGAPTNWQDSFIPTLDPTWGLIPGTNWVSYETSAPKQAAIVSNQTYPGAWSVPLPGSNWISVNDGQAGSGGLPSFTNASTNNTYVSKAKFKAAFTLPTTGGATLSIQLASDDQTTLYLNGVKFSQQENNSAGPFVTHSTTVGFVTGINLLEFDVVNYGGPLGICYKGQVAYTGGSVTLLSGSGQIGATDSQNTYVVLSGQGADTTAGQGPGVYLARTTFELPVGFQSASMSLTILADNAVSDIVLNGYSIGGQNTAGNTLSYFAPGSETTHTTSTNFVAGTNTLDFTIQNYANAVGLDYLGQVTYVPPAIGSTGPTGTSGATGGGINTPDFDNQIMAIGGTPTYTYTVINDAQTTLPIAAISITGSVLRVNATNVPVGTYSVHLRASDSLGEIDDQIVTVNVYDSSKFNIINQSITLTPANFPYNGSIPLVQYGGSGVVTWTIVTSTTTLPGASISGSNLLFTAAQLGTYQVGLTASDAMSKLATKIIRVTVTSANAYKLVDGQIELAYSDSTGTAGGNHNFSFSLRDKTHALIQRSYSYLLNQQASIIASRQYAINKYWAASDTSPYSLPISGSVSGLTIGDVPAVTLSNGIRISTVGASSAVVLSGSPTTYENSLAFTSVPLKRGSVNIGFIHRAYVVVPYAGTSPDQLGVNVVNTVPAIVGSMFTLNPQKPYFNSPDNSRDVTWTARIKTGSVLPKGISLDKNTGLLYGPVVDTITSQTPTTIEFVDSAGAIRGTFIVKFDFVANDFDLISSLPVGKAGTPYNEGSILTNSTANLTSASLYYGHLPAGLTLGVSSNTVTLRGTPTESGYFDVWIKAVNADGKSAYIYRRIEITYTVPLTTVTTALPSVKTSLAYSVQMQAVGGTGKYTWTLGSGSLPTGITMNSAGLISGTTSMGSYSQPVNFIVTDSAGATQNVTITLAINNVLTLLTASPLPAAIVGQPYSYQLQAEGGTTPYHGWGVDTGSPALPSGLTIDGTTGVISGTVSSGGYNQNLVIKVTDAASATVNKTLTLTTKDTRVVIGINTQGVGPVSRGCPYQGVLAVIGSNTIAPFRWTSTGLPVGLSLTPNAADQGATAFISGSTTDVFTNKAVSVTVIDNGGGTVSSSVMMTSVPSVAITYPVNQASLPQGRIGAAYSIRLAATGCNLPIIFGLNVSSPALPGGFTLNSNGTLSGTASAPYNQTIVVDSTDSIGDVATAHIGLEIVSSALIVSTTSIPVIPTGQAWSYQLQATGGQQPYTWTCGDPIAGSALPSGWQVEVHSTGNGADGYASGTYTVVATGGSGTYLGTGVFNWDQGYTATIHNAQQVIVNNLSVPISVTDLVTKQTIAGTISIGISGWSNGQAFAIDQTDVLTGLVKAANVLPTSVTLSPSGLLTTTGTSEVFDRSVLFTVTDSLGAVASKPLEVAVAAQSQTGVLKTGIDLKAGTSSNFLGFIGTAPGDIATITPRSLGSFYLYGAMPGALASQLTVSTSVDNGGNPYQNVTGVVESVDSAGLVAIKLVFAPINTGVLIGPSPLTYTPSGTGNHGLSVTITNTGTGAKLTGNFTFTTQNFGTITLSQAGGVSLPSFTVNTNLA